MLRHVVLVAWKDEATDEDIAAASAALGGLPALIPQIRRYEFGPDLGLSPSSSYDFVIVADFDDETSWQEYLEHPDHVAAATTAIRPIAGRVDRIQYTV